MWEREKTLAPQVFHSWQKAHRTVEETISISLCLLLKRKAEEGGAQFKAERERNRNRRRVANTTVRASGMWMLSSALLRTFAGCCVSTQHLGWTTRTQAGSKESKQGVER